MMSAQRASQTTPFSNVNGLFASAALGRCWASRLLPYISCRHKHSETLRAHRSWFEGVLEIHQCRRQLAALRISDAVPCRLQWFKLRIVQRQRAGKLSQTSQIALIQVAATRSQRHGLFVDNQHVWWIWAPASVGLGPYASWICLFPSI
jgi:hypothetical protein